MRANRSSPRAGRSLIKAAALCVGMMMLAAGARGEIELQGVQWQRVERAQGRPAKPIDIAEAGIVPGAPVKGRLVAKVKLLNRGAAAEGILLRYAVAAKIAPLSQPQVPAAWALPFMLDEKRVPRASANQFLEATLDPTALMALYLRKIYRMGYWPQELKLQVMLEPRAGSAGPLQVIESALPFRK